MNKYIPETALIEVTRACNFNCMHCGAEAGTKREDELSLEEIKLLIADLKELGCKSISLMGGEIFLRNDWQQIVLLVVESGLRCGIITNGYLLNYKKLKFIKNSGVIQLGISLDASCSELQYEIRGIEDSFERAINAIKLSLQEKIQYVTVITAVSKKNVDQFEGIFDLLSSFDDYIDWQIKLASSHSETRFSKSFVIDENDYLKVAEFIKGKKELVKRNQLKVNISGAHDLGYCSELFKGMPQSWQGCLSGLKTIGVQSDGNIKGCLALPDSFIEGNIRSNSLNSIWNSDNKFVHTRNFKKEALAGVCKTCDKNNVCNGGCHDFCYSLAGSVYSVPFCLYKLKG